MLLTKENQVLSYQGREFAIGQTVRTTSDCDYLDLTGYIYEIRTDEDKDTENETPDIYCCFSEPDDPVEIERLEQQISSLYGYPKTLDEICLDCLIMAPDELILLEKWGEC